MIKKKKGTWSKGNKEKRYGVKGGREGRERGEGVRGGSEGKRTRNEGIGRKGGRVGVERGTRRTAGSMCDQDRTFPLRESCRRDAAHSTTDSYKLPSNLCEVKSAV